ncbi:MAG: hydroxyphenylacetyl-CoA thioesterase PaaI [Geminicoccaceae bacterium]
MSDHPADPATGPDEQKLAEAVRTGLFERDHASQALGIRVDEIAPGFARCSMTVRQDMLNGHDTCHGGLIFTLADSAFAFACNACNRTTVALGGQITFIAPAHLGDRLIARACEQNRTKRTGTYDVDVATEDGRTIALFRGNAYETRGPVVAISP